MSRIPYALALLAAIGVSVPASAAPIRKAPAKKVPGKGKGKGTAAEEAALEKSLEAGAEEPAPVRPKKLSESKAADEDASDSAMGWHGIDVQVGVGVFSRKLSYNEDLFKALRPYSLPLGPALSLRASLLPLSVGKTLHIGAYVRGDIAVGIESKNPAGQAFASSAGVFEGAVAAQLQVDALALGLRVGYGTQWFSAESIAGARETIDPGIPSVKHTYLLATVTGAYAATSTLEVNGAFSYLAGQGAGALSSDAWFPRATSRGFDVQLGAIYNISPSIGLGVEANYRRIALSMNSVPGDKKVAGGATDDTPGARIFLNLRW